MSVCDGLCPEVKRLLSEVEDWKLLRAQAVARAVQAEAEVERLTAEVKRLDRLAAERLYGRPA